MQRLDARVVVGASTARGLDLADTAPGADFPGRPPIPHGQVDTDIDSAQWWDATAHITAGCIPPRWQPRIGRRGGRDAGRAGVWSARGWCVWAGPGEEVRVVGVEVRGVCMCGWGAGVRRGAWCAQTGRRGTVGGVGGLVREESRWSEWWTIDLCDSSCVA